MIGTRCGFVIPALITRKRLKMHGIATARQHERTREAELRMIHQVAPSLEEETFHVEQSAQNTGNTLFLNEMCGSEFMAVYPWIKLETA